MKLKRFTTWQLKNVHSLVINNDELVNRGHSDPITRLAYVQEKCKGKGVF